MRVTRLLPLLLVATAGPAAGQSARSATAQGAGQPRLVIAISVDQLGADLFEAYRPHFRGGLRKLADGGVVFTNGYQAHAASETCPGHSTILTGSHPARSGIVANNWVDQSVAREDKRVYCAEDPAIKAASGYTVSLTHLKVPTLGERLKRANPASRVVSVSGKDRAALMLGGRGADQLWWWGGKGFVSTLTARPAAVVAQINANVSAKLARPSAALVPPPVCEARAAPLDIRGERDLNLTRFARAAGDAAAFRVSPEMDAATLALAAGIAIEQRLGLGRATDLLAIGLSGTDYIGHAYGSGGIEMCLQLTSLDRDLGDFFRVLDRQGLRYSVVLTADHGVLDVPERARPRGEWLDPKVEIGAIEAAVRASTGIAGKLLLGEGGDIYANRALGVADRARVLAAAAAYLRGQRQVEAVFTAADLRRTAIATTPPSRWTTLQRLRASYDPARSGDLLLVLKAGVMPIVDPGPTYAATHGSPWDYDRRVPILFWQPGLAAARRSEEAMTVDILPTLASRLGLGIARAEIDGQCLELKPGWCAGR